MARQCELLDCPRSTYYYKPCHDNRFNLKVMKEIDQIYTAYPFYGKRRISIMLKQRGLDVGVDRTRTLMQRMGIAAIYPKPNLSRAHPEHKIYPYLLRGIDVSRRDQVWSTDITYIPMVDGFFYLTAIIDWFTRYILAWELSNSLDRKFCRNILKKAIKSYHPHKKKQC